MIKPVTGYIWMMNGFNRKQKNKNWLYSYYLNT